MKQLLPASTLIALPVAGFAAIAFQPDVEPTPNGSEKTGTLDDL